MSKNKIPIKEKQIIPSKSIIRSMQLKALLCFIVLGLAAYATAFDNEFTNWDDQGYVYENPLVTQFGMDKIPVIFSTLNIAGNYHPLTILSLGINYVLLGENAWGFILINLLFHIANTWLVFLIVLSFRQKDRIAWAAAIMFLLHPLHVESVAWISERKDVLYTFFWLLSWHQWLLWRENKKTVHYILVLLFFILSSLSKGMAITLTGVIVLTDYFIDAKFQALFEKKKLLSYLPLVIISLVFGSVAIISQRAQGTIIESSNYTGLESTLLVFYGYMFYLIRMIIPWGLAAFYPYPASSGQTFPMEVYIAPILFACILFYVIKTFKQDSRPGFVFAFYTICIIIVLQILPVGVAITADRYFYVSSIGLCMGFGWLLEYVEKKSSKRIAMGILIFFTLAWGLLTARQANTWQNSIALFENVIQYHPKASVGYNNIGTILGMEKKDSLALWYYRKAIEYNPRYSEAWNNMGILYKDIGNIDSALYSAKKALELYPGYTNAYSNLGNIYFSMKEYALSAAQYKRVTEINPSEPGGFLNLGAALQMQGDRDGAEQAYQQVLKFNPGDFRALHNLGDSRFNRGDYSGAEQYYKQVLAYKPEDTEAVRKLQLLDDTRSGKIKDPMTNYQEQIASEPTNPKPYLNAGTELFRQGKYKEAIQYFEKALSLDANLPEAWNNLGTSKGITGDVKGALICFQKALQLNPDYHEPLYNMGLAYGQLGDQTKAVEYYQKAARAGHAGAQNILKDNGFSW